MNKDFFDAWVKLSINYRLWMQCRTGTAPRGGHSNRVIAMKDDDFKKHIDLIPACFIGIFLCLGLLLFLTIKQFL